MEELLNFALENDDLVDLVASLCNATRLYISMIDAEAEDEAEVQIETQTDFSHETSLEDSRRSFSIPLTGGSFELNGDILTYHPSPAVKRILFSVFPRFLRQYVHQVKHVCFLATCSLPGWTEVLLSAICKTETDDTRAIKRQRTSKQQNKRNNVEKLEFIESDHGLVLVGRGILSGIRELTINTCFSLEIAEQMELSKLILSNGESLEKVVFAGDIPFERKGFEAIIKSLQHHQNLCELRLHCHLFQAESAEIQIFVDAILGLPKLEILDIAGSELATELDNEERGRIACSFLGQVMEKQDLWIRLGSTCSQESCWQEMGKRLGTSSRISAIDLLCHRFSAGGFAAIIEGLQANHHLKEINLVACFFPPQSMSPFATAVSKSVSLKNISIGLNQEEERSAFLRGISESNLEALGLTLDIFGEESGPLLTQVLTSCQMLHTLSVSIHFPEEIFARALSLGLPSAKSLKKLTIQGIGFLQGSLPLFLIGIENNMSITALQLPTDEGMDVAKVYVRLNRLGRQKVLDPKFPTYLLPNVYAKTRDDLDSLFYLWRQKPLNITLDD